MGKTFEVLAEAATREISDWICELITSEWRYRCGVFSHLKPASVPHLVHHAQLSLAYLGHVECQEEETRHGDKLMEY